MVTTTHALGGRYELGEVLGTGGMATVWRATDAVLGREVAVKALSPQYAADAGFMARFEREARDAALLSHPRLVRVYDCGIDGGTAFIVTELVEGRTLRQVLDDAGMLRLGQAAGIAVAVCEALEVAHAAGLVHGDIKPANIVVSGGEVKVLDFGIPRTDASADGTQTLGALGTVAYLSPEQASGGPTGPQSDLYSLGCVLFEMLTGEPPFTADSPIALACRHVHDDPGRPSARQLGVPAQLDGITARLLAKDPSARPASAAAARADLLAALSPNATAVLTSRHEDGVPPGLNRRSFRYPTRSEVGLAGALAAALVALVAVLLSGTPGRAAPRAAQSMSPRASLHSLGSQVVANNAHKPAQSRPAANQPAHPGPPAPASPKPTRPARSEPTRSASPDPTRSASPEPSRPPVRPRNAVPPLATATARFVGDLAAGFIDGQVAPPAGQDLYNHLQHLLFGPPGQTPQQLKQQYTQLVQSYDHHHQQGQITGHAAIALRRALRDLAAAVRAG